MSVAVIFGEVLFDVFPDRQVLGGAPFNVAWHLQALGDDPCMVSRVGHDALGDKIREAMQQHGMDVRYLQQDERHATGQVTVTFEQDEPQYDIQSPVAYDFIDETGLPALNNQDGLLYHGSLALRHEGSRRT